MRRQSFVQGEGETASASVERSGMVTARENTHMVQPPPTLVLGVNEVQADCNSPLWEME